MNCCPVRLYESPRSAKSKEAIALKKELDAEKKFVPNKKWFYEMVGRGAR